MKRINVRSMVLGLAIAIVPVRVAAAEAANQPEPPPQPQAVTQTTLSATEAREGTSNPQPTMAIDPNQLADLLETATKVTTLEQRVISLEERLTETEKQNVARSDEITALREMVQGLRATVATMQQSSITGRRLNVSSSLAPDKEKKAKAPKVPMVPVPRAKFKAPMIPAPRPVDVPSITDEGPDTTERSGAIEFPGVWGGVVKVTPGTLHESRSTQSKRVVAKPIEKRRPIVANVSVKPVLNGNLSDDQVLALLNMYTRLSERMDRYDKGKNSPNWGFEKQKDLSNLIRRVFPKWKGWPEYVTRQEMATLVAEELKKQSSHSGGIAAGPTNDRWRTGGFMSVALALFAIPLGLGIVSRANPLSPLNTKLPTFSWLANNQWAGFILIAGFLLHLAYTFPLIRAH